MSNLTKLLFGAGAVLALAMVFGCVTPAEVLTGTPFTLTVVHNNDGESALLADDYSGSVAQFATVVKRLVDEAGAENSVVVSSGDNFLAGLEYAASQGVYDAQALNMAGFEVSAIGNHEFDFGPAGLARFAEAAEFSLVSSNLDVSNDADLSGFVGTKIVPYTIIEKGGNSIGFIGATTEQIAYISGPGQDVIINDVKSSLQQAANTLTEMGVNVIIALTHLQNVDEEKALAQEIDGVDIFVAGGGDNLLGDDGDIYLVRTDRDGNDVIDEPEEPYPFRTQSPNGDPVVVVATDGSYNYVGRLTVDFDENGIITSINDAQSGPVGVTPDLPAVPSIQNDIVNVVFDQIEAFQGQTVGRTISGLDGTRAVVRTQESTLGNAISDGYLYVASRGYDGDVDLAFTNGGGIRRSVVVAAGNDVTMHDILTALPFSNFLTVVEGLSADDLKAIFEHSVSRLPEAGGQFLQVAGVTVEYDSARPSGDRVRSIAVGGETVYNDGVRSSRTFNAVTNSFIAAGGDNYQTLGAIPKERKINIGVSYAEGLEIYLRENTPLASELEGRLVDISSR